MTVNASPPAIPKRYSRPDRVEFWGKKVKRQTTLSNQCQGDGRVLLWVTTVCNRPSGWLIRVDAKWLEGIDYAHNLIEEVLGMLEDEFGNFSHRMECLVDEDGLTEDEAFDHPDTQYPCVKADVGFAWSVYRVWYAGRWRDWPDYDREARAKIIQKMKGGE